MSYELSKIRYKAAIYEWAKVRLGIKGESVKLEIRKTSSIHLPTGQMPEHFH